MRSALKNIEDLVLNELGDSGADLAPAPSPTGPASTTDAPPATPAPPAAAPTEAPSENGTAKPKRESRRAARKRAKQEAARTRAEPPATNEDDSVATLAPPEIDVVTSSQPDPIECTETHYADSSPYGSKRHTTKIGPVLLLGGTGSFGSGLAVEMINQGIDVRMLVRDQRRAASLYGNHPQLTITQGDVFDVNAVANAIDGAEAVVHAVNFPASKWQPYLVRATESIIGACEMSGSLLVFPGSTHALGRQTNRPLPETTPYQPSDKYGQVRAHIQELFETAANEGRIRALILRVSDLFGPTVRNPLVDGIFLSAAQGKPMTMYGNPEAPHFWCYMPDVARVTLAMMAMARSAHCFDRYEIINAPGHILRPQYRFHEMVADVAGRSCKVDKKSWGSMKLASLKSPIAKELVEMRHLWDEGVLLDPEKLERLFPQFEPTPLNEAIATTLASYQR